MKPIYSMILKKKDHESEYLFYEDGTYTVDWWDEDDIEEKGAKWRIKGDELQYWLKYNETWHPFCRFDDDHIREWNLKICEEFVSWYNHGMLLDIIYEHTCDKM